MTVIVRMLKTDDLPQVIKICNEVREYHREILGGYFVTQDDEQEKEELLHCIENNSKCLCLVAEQNKEIIGMAISEFKNNLSLEKAKLCNIENICVVKKARKQGIGDALMQRIIEECKRRNTDEIKLDVFAANETACKFYENHGFTTQRYKMSLKLK